MIVGRIQARQSTIVGRKVVSPTARSSPPDDNDVRVERAGHHSKQHFKNIAADDQKWESFAISLTGETADERSPEQNKALGQLRKEVLLGDVSPSYASNGPGNRLGLVSTKRSSSGIYVPSEGPSDGSVILPSNLRGKALQKASNDRFGEAIADRAMELGVDVSGGNVAAGSRPPSLADIQSETTSALDGEDNGASLFEAVTGISFDDLAVEQAILLELILQNAASGRNLPTVVVAGADSGLTLPTGVNAAYVPEKNVIILRSGLTQKEQKAALREEFGEFLASEADKAGISVGPGDAGARVLKALTGQKASEADRKDKPSDGGTVSLFGKTMAAEFQTSGSTTGLPPVAGGTPDSTVYGSADVVEGDSGKTLTRAALQAADTDGNGALSVSELVAIDGVSEAQAQKLVRIYGVPSNEGEFFIPLGDSGFDGVGVNLMVEEGVITIADTGDGPQASVVLSNAGNATIANALVRYTGYLRFAATPVAERNGRGASDFMLDAQETGISAEELDFATDAVLGDTKPLDGKNGHRDAIFSDFKGPNSKTGLTVNDLTDILDTGAIYIKRDPTDTTSDFIGFSAHRGMRPTITSGTDFTNFVMGFDANGNGVIEFSEFQAALTTLYGADSVSTEEAALLFNMFSSYDPATGRALTFSDAEAVFDEGAFVVGSDGNLVVTPSKLSPLRIQTALFSQIAEMRGIPEGQVVFATAAELSAASTAIFGAPLDMTKLSIRSYVTPNFDGDSYYSADNVQGAVYDGALVVGDDQTLTVSDELVAPSGATPDASSAYRTVHQDHPGSSNYGTGFFQGGHQVSSGQVHLGEGVSPDGLTRTTIYAPPEASEPEGSTTSVVNPLEFRSRRVAEVEVGQVNGYQMNRVDNGDGTVTWTIKGVKQTVKAGSELDNYLLDFQSFMRMTAVILEGPLAGESNHLEGRPNLELSQSSVDQNGNTVQVWVPRTNQFRTDANGNAAPIESGPVVTVNGEIVNPSRMFVGLSPVDGQEIIGFEYQDPISGGVTARPHRHSTQRAYEVCGRVRAA